MSVSSDRLSFQIAMEDSPIILTGGVTASQGGAVPIIQYIQPGIASFDQGTGNVTSINTPAPYTVFARFRPMPSSRLIAQQIASYPLANQGIAANAVITQPLNISMLMICPVGVAGGYTFKRQAITALQATLAQHNITGGTYSVVTPAYIYTGCLMLNMIDVSGGESNQAQFQYQLDFIQPLVTLAQAQQALNNVTQTINDGTPPVGGTTSSAPGMPVGNPTTQSTQGPTALSQLGSPSITQGTQ